MEEVKNTKEEGKKDGKICSFFSKVTPDAWVIAVAILLASIFLVTALMPGGVLMRKGETGKQEIKTRQR